jgi:TctA family transporter
VKQKFAKLIDVKSIVTLLMTLAMIFTLTGVFKPSNEAFGLFATTYGAVITYFFTKKNDKTEDE